MKVLAVLSGALAAVAALPTAPAGLELMQVNVCPNYPFCHDAVTAAAAAPVVPGLDQFNQGVALIKQLEMTNAPVYPVVPGSAAHYAAEAAQLALMGKNAGQLYHEAQVNRHNQQAAQIAAYAATL